jgi:predicted transcriptional regulator
MGRPRTISPNEEKVARLLYGKVEGLTFGEVAEFTTLGSKNTRDAIEHLSEGGFALVTKDYVRNEEAVVRLTEKGAELIRGFEHFERKEGKGGKVTPPCPFCKQDGFKNNYSLGQHKRKCRENPYNKKKVEESKAREVEPDLTITDDVVETNTVPGASVNMTTTLNFSTPYDEVMDKIEDKKAAEEREWVVHTCRGCGSEIKVWLDEYSHSLNGHLMRCPVCR